MKITSVEAMVLRLPEVNAACDGTQDTCLIRIDTDAGISGWGEVDSCPTVVKAVVDAPLSHQICNGFANALVGRDALDIGDCTDAMDEAANYYGRVGVGSHAMAGINLALWDIAGKAADKPAYQLLGGQNGKRFRAYCSILFGDTPEETYELGRRFADQGFMAVKFGWGPMGESETSDIAHVREARRGVGDEVDVLIDAGQVWDWETALERARQFQEFRPFWIEEPLHPQDIEGFARLTAESPIPIATGEAESRLPDFERLVTDGGLHWIQPDPGRCGLSIFVAAGQFAHQHDAKVVNHSFKSGITIAASLHGLASVPHGEIFEFCMTDSPLRHEITNEQFEVVDGYVSVPEGPGLGVTVNESTIDRYRVA
ncbi:MAG: mandelate racemase [Gemmatimonadetes bacterium]|nr:mandelate racemase [Gemmatimonadota bacterium]|tara:strand:+ start:913 stop:2025 length:1113 start_codon:yes stop_codon:yes gene_type:complete